MPEDKRIIKTKRNLKQALIALLADKPFEQITVKELCNFSKTSRITFYTYYQDKYDLAKAIFLDMIDIAADDYYSLQKENNQTGNAVIGCCNLLECILNLYYNHLDFFGHTKPEKSPYLNYTFSHYVFRYVEQCVEKESHALRPKYSVKKTTAFICGGLWGFINECGSENCPPDVIRKEAKEILKELLKSEVLTQKN